MTACGYTTSSQDTLGMYNIPLEEAPFKDYLRILRENGYEQEADESEEFYVEVLTNVESKDGVKFTKEQVMNTSFNNLCKAVELILEHASQEIMGLTQSTPIMPISQNMLLGKASEKLSKEQLQHLIQRQMQLHEEERTKQQMMRP